MCPRLCHCRSSKIFRARLAGRCNQQDDCFRQHSSPPLNSSGSPVDMDLDSPFSPGSASDLSDLFEPPSASPPTSSLPKIARQHKGKKASDSKAWQSIIGESDKQNHNKKANSRKFPGSGELISCMISQHLIYLFLFQAPPLHQRRMSI